MRELVERIEELLYMQEKLVNLLLLSRSRKVKLSTSTAFDLLYYNIELLDLISELLGTSETFQEDYPASYSMSLVLEALSWMGIVLPTIEEACPIFLQGVGIRGKEPLQRISFVLKGLEKAYRRGEYHYMMQVAKELQAFSSLLKYQILLARKAYTNLV